MDRGIRLLLGWRSFLLFLLPEKRTRHDEQEYDMEVIHVFLPNDQGEPRVPLARSPATAGGVTAVLVGSGAWLNQAAARRRKAGLREQAVPHSEPLACNVAEEMSPIMRKSLIFVSKATAATC